MATEDTFRRYEKKYLLTKTQYDEVYPLLCMHMEEDRYGVSTICNIYYDTPNYRLIRESIEKPVYKEKLRLRAYGTPTDDTDVFVEIKKKYDGIVYKRRVSLPYHAARQWLSQIDEEGKSQIGQEIAYFLQYYENLQPTCVLCYDRIALYGKEDAQIRVTIDTNIRWRTHDLDLRCGDAGEALFDAPMYLMEVKLPEYMPDWLIRILNDREIYPTSFSKYGRVYQKLMHNI